MKSKYKCPINFMSFPGLLACTLIGIDFIISRRNIITLILGFIAILTVIIYIFLTLAVYFKKENRSS